MTADQLPDRLENVGPGWSPILTRLHETLLALGATGYRAADVKEKHGALRVHITAVPARLRTAAQDAADAAEQESRTGCEHCGRPGTWRDVGYWGVTLCDA